MVLTQAWCLRITLIRLVESEGFSTPFQALHVTLPLSERVIFEMERVELRMFKFRLKNDFLRFNIEKLDLSCLEVTAIHLAVIMNASPKLLRVLITKQRVKQKFQWKVTFT